MWLLDTHVWLWSQLEPERLGEGTRALLMDQSQPLVVATISTLEIARLVARGQVTLRVPVGEWVRRSTELLALRTLELSHEVAIEAYALLDAFHRDPADRILVATSRIHGLTLVTADERILAYPHVTSRDSRT
ncbi:MAG: type II toxin-antitoxin system VapC family toxin [Candidatus Schekmanbacteria bacterium]|nr:type II toxin-antitoxin system VapC family toxin [Candidatus Schekmanbacteria bacterium]